MLACVYIPDFAIRVERHHNPTLSARPLILANRSRKNATVYAACDTALRMGVKLSMLTTKALALCPDGEFKSMSPDLYQQATQKLVQTLRLFTDHLEVEQSYRLTLWLDIGDLPFAEARGIATKILQTILDTTPFSLSIGVANGKFTSRIAAMKARPKSVSVIHAGNEAGFLASFPIQYLALNKQTARELSRLRIETMGQFAALPRVGVIERFGKVGGQIYDLAKGKDTIVLPRYVPPEESHAARTFEEVIADRSIIEAAISELSHKLAAEMAKKALAASEVTLIVHFEKVQQVKTACVLRQPISKARSLQRVVTEGFESLSVKSAVAKIEIILTNLHPLVSQQFDLFGQVRGYLSVLELVEQLRPRHADTPFRMVKVNTRKSHVPEYQFQIEKVDVR